MSRFDNMLSQLNAEAQKKIHNMEGNVEPQMIEAAQFDLIIKRDSANIGEYLPFPIFGAAALKSGLQTEIASYVPSSAVSLVAMQFGLEYQKNASGTLPQLLSNATKLILQFYDGVVFDTVTITCTSVSYPSFVESTLSDVFRLRNIRYSISDTAQSDQYSQSLNFSKKTIFGKQVNNPLTPASFRSPSDFQTGIVDITVNADVDKETVIWHSIKNVSQFRITLSVFVSRTARFNSNLL